MWLGGHTGTQELFSVVGCEGGLTRPSKKRIQDFGQGVGTLKYKQFSQGFQIPKTTYSELHILSACKSIIQQILSCQGNKALRDKEKPVNAS